MKKVKFIVAAILVVAVGAGIFWACQKEVTTENSSVTKESNKILKDNNNNPFDYVGINHNQYLDYLLTNINFQTISKENLFEYGKTYRPLNLTWNQFSEIEQNQIEHMYEDGINLSIFQEICTTFCNQATIDTIAILDVYLLANFMDSINDDTTISIASYYNGIVYYEGLLCDRFYQINPSPTTVEYEFFKVVLSYCAVAKHSANYFIDVASTTDPASFLYPYKFQVGFYTLDNSYTDAYALADVYRFTGDFNFAAGVAESRSGLSGRIN